MTVIPIVISSLVTITKGLVQGLEDLEIRERMEAIQTIALLRSYLPNPSARAGYDTRSIFKQSLTGLNSEFSFSLTSCLTKAEEPSLPYYLPIAGGRIIGFIPFPRVLVLREMQSVSSRIWTRVAVSISYGDNHYTTGIIEIPQNTKRLEETCCHWNSSGKPSANAGVKNSQICKIIIMIIIIM